MTRETQSTSIELRQTLAELQASSSEELRPGTQLGPFVVEALLGKGGMGAVYRVLQERPVHRTVALKLVKASHEAADRWMFELERQALASLNHPAIAKLFDAGEIPATDSGDAKQYFVMELINGPTLDRYIASLPLADRMLATVHLLSEVCMGVQHAHQMRLVHRDLKPSNILVPTIDGQARVKVIDFGLASAQRAKAGFGGGTPAYMAPEQHDPQAVLDGRTDVHALGIILVELLCASLHENPLPIDWQSDSIRSALGVESSLGSAEKHSTDQNIAQLERALRLGLPEALHAITRRACAASPSERYASALELAQDLQAFVADRPVRAMPPSRLYLSRLFVRRNRLAVALTTAIVLSLILGLAAALYGLKQARAERAIAQAQALRAQQTSAFLTDILTGVSPDQAASMDTALLKSILERAALRSTNALAELPEARAEVLGTVARSYMSISAFDLALKHADAAIAAGASSALSIREQLDLEQTRAEAIASSGDEKQASRLMLTLCSKMQQALGDKDIDTLRCRSSLAWDYFELGQYSLALEVSKQTQADLEAIKAPIPSQLYNLRVFGASLSSSGKHAEAEQVLRRLVADSIKEHGAQHASTLRARNSFCVSLMQQQRHAEAADEYRKLVPDTEKAYGVKHQATIVAYANYAGALRKSGRLKESGEYYHKAHGLAVEVLGPENPSSIVADLNIANFQIDNQQADLALERLSRLEPVVSRVFGNTHDAMIELLRARAKAHTALQNQSNAIADWRRVLNILKSAESPDAVQITVAEEALREL